MAKQYERLEYSLKKFPGAVSVEVVPPQGTPEKVFPFLYQPVKIHYNRLGFERIIKSGEQYLKFRYTPKTAGEYKFTVSGADGEPLWVFSESVEKSESRGYVGVSKKDPRYFEYSDGSPFIPIGINTAYPTRYSLSDGNEFGIAKADAYIGLKQYERWFKKCRENGVNTARIWLGCEYFNPIESESVIFRYEQFTKLDLLLELALKYDIKLKLTFEYFRTFKDGHEGIAKMFERKLALGGLPCRSMEQWLTSEKWRESWLLKIGEFAKRYAGDTSIFAFEFWNEMNCADASFDDIIGWNRKMREHARLLFPDNMVVNSLGSCDSPAAEEQYDKFPWEIFDFKQIHSYLDCGAQKEVCRHSLIDLMSDNFKKHPAKDFPVIIAETGAVNNRHTGPFRYYPADSCGLIFADSVYAPFFLGSAGCGHIWHWEVYVENKNLFKMYRPFYELTRDINPADEQFEPKDLSDDGVYALALEGKRHTLVYVRNRSDSWENVLKDLNEPEPVSADLKTGEYSKLFEYKIWDGEAESETYPGGVRINKLRRGLFLKLEK